MVLRDVIGDFQVNVTAMEVRFATKKGALEGAFVLAADSQQENLVAGAGFEPATFGL
jgi:hypothetical protein